MLPDIDIVGGIPNREFAVDDIEVELMQAAIFLVFALIVLVNENDGATRPGNAHHLQDSLQRVHAVIERIVAVHEIKRVWCKCIVQCLGTCWHGCDRRLDLKIPDDFGVVLREGIAGRQLDLDMRMYIAKVGDGPAPTSRTLASFRFILSSSADTRAENRVSGFNLPA